MNDNEIHLKNYLRIIVKRKYTVTAFFIVVFVIALLGSLNYTPVYTAFSKVLIEKNDTNPLMMNYRYGAAYDPEFLATQAQIIKSEPVSIKVVNTLDLEHQYESFFKNVKKTDPVNINPVVWFKNLYATLLKIAGIGKVMPENPGKETSPNVDPEGTPSAAIQNYIRMISRGIHIEPVEESDIVTISYTSTSPEFSMRVVNSVTEAYIEQTFEMKIAASKHAIAWMTEKAEKERGRLEKKEKALQSYMRKENIITIADRIAITPERLIEISTLLTKAEVNRKELQSLNEKIDQMSKHLENAETIKVIASDVTLQSLRSQLMETDQRITELSKKYGPKHPVIKRARADADKLEEKRKKEIERIILSIKNEFDLAKSREKDLRELLGKIKNEAARLNEKNIQYGILKREIETTRYLYDALVKKIKEQSITDQAQAVSIWVVEKAKAPRYPSNRRNKQRMTLGILFGLLGGIGLAFFLEYLDQTISRPDDIERRFGVAVLGMVPFLKSKTQRPAKAVVEDSTTVFSESYKAIRTGILLSSAKTAPQILLITSAHPEEGKTITAVNIAVTLAAQASTKVLLIDADLRKPRIDKIFDIDHSIGLSTFLAGVSDRNIIQEGPVPNLFIMPAGPIPPNPSELLGAGLMRTMLDSLRKKYDFIVLDSSPILSVTDALLLSKVVDGTIMVIKAGKSTYEIVNRGVKALNDIDARVIGTVLNAVDIKKSTYYDHRYYQYYSTQNKKMKR
jgi:capsular exopolysaccharide synthesis family protein